MPFYDATGLVLLDRETARADQRAERGQAMRQIVGQFQTGAAAGLERVECYVAAGEDRPLNGLADLAIEQDVVGHGALDCAAYPTNQLELEIGKGGSQLRNDELGGLDVWRMRRSEKGNAFLPPLAVSPTQLPRRGEFFGVGDGATVSRYDDGRGPMRREILRVDFSTTNDKRGCLDEPLLDLADKAAQRPSQPVAGQYLGFLLLLDVVRAVDHGKIRPDEADNIKQRCHVGVFEDHHGGAASKISDRASQALVGRGEEAGDDVVDRDPLPRIHRCLERLVRRGLWHSDVKAPRRHEREVVGRPERDEDDV